MMRARRKWNVLDESGNIIITTNYTEARKIKGRLYTQDGVDASIVPVDDTDPPLPDYIANDDTLFLHHTASDKGYIPRNQCIVEPYKGYFGEGYRVKKWVVETSRYHIVEYYIRRGTERPMIKKLPRPKNLTRPAPLDPDIFPGSLKRFRESAGLTVEKAAKELMVSQASIYSWEDGKHLPPEYIQRLFLAEFERIIKKTEARKKAFPDALIDACNKAGFSSQSLADVLGIQYNTVYTWASGRRLPPEYVQRLILEEIERISEKKDT